MANPGAIEVKANIAGGVGHALGVLGLQAGTPRQVWFLDDLTDGAKPALPLLNAGIVLRLRRGDKEQSTIKLRPCRRTQLTAQWQGGARDTDYKIEGDWSGDRHSLAASCVAELNAGTIDRVLDGQIADAFTRTQREFLAECADIRVALEATTVLKPIAATQWKGITLGTVGEVAAERWIVDGLDFLELSIRVPADTAAAQQRMFTDEILSRGLTLDKDGESKTVRVMRRLAGLPDEG